MGLYLGTGLVCGSGVYPDLDGQDGTVCVHDDPTLCACGGWCYCWRETQTHRCCGRVGAQKKKGNQYLVAQQQNRTVPLDGMEAPSAGTSRPRKVVRQTS